MERLLVCLLKIKPKRHYKIFENWGISIPYSVCFLNNVVGAYRIAQTDWWSIYHFEQFLEDNLSRVALFVWVIISKSFSGYMLSFWQTVGISFISELTTYFSLTKKGKYASSLSWALTLCKLGLPQKILYENLCHVLIKYHWMDCQEHSTNF